MHCKATAQHKSFITVFIVPTFEKLSMLAVRTVTTVALRCTAGQDRWPRVVTVPWPKASRFCGVLCDCFPDLYLYSSTCSL